MVVVDFLMKGDCYGNGKEWKNNFFWLIVKFNCWLNFKFIVIVFMIVVFDYFVYFNFF